MKHKNLFLIVMGLAIGVVLVRGGFALVAPVMSALGTVLGMVAKIALPFVIPLVIGYFGLRLVRNKLRNTVHGGQQSDPISSRQNTIDLCPECGEIMADEHVCKHT